jgi:patatin-related protein
MEVAMAKVPLIDHCREVRFAVVLYGGVSLAVYINGVAQELLRLVRATAPRAEGSDQPLIAEVGGTEAVYREIGQILGRDSEIPGKPAVDDPIHTRFVIDVLSGNSAGGINGVFLAKALANGQNLDPLKDLWVSEGDIEVLLNDRRSVAGFSDLSVQDPPQSLLNGERMYRKLLAAFEGMEDGKPKSSSPLLGDELDLYVTTTDTRGLPLPIQLADKEVLEKRHRHVFHFHYKAYGENDFAAANNPFLAFASRCTSSFPFAFEPIQLADLNERRLVPGGVPTDQLEAWKERFFPTYRQPAGSQLEKHVYDPSARAFSDGGALDNKPFGFAIDALSARTSHLPMVRKLLYVEPSPEHPEDRRAPPERPNAIETAVAGATLARYETIREDVDRVLARNRLIERVDRFLDELDSDVQAWAKKLSGDPEKNLLTLDLAQRFAIFGPAYGGYHRLKVAATTDDFTSWAARAAGFEIGSGPWIAIRYLIKAWRELRYAPFTPSTILTSLTQEETRKPESDFLFEYDLGFRLRRLDFVLSRLDRLYNLDDRAWELPRSLAPGRSWQDEEKAEFRRALRQLRPRLADVLVGLRRVQTSLVDPSHENPLGPIIGATAIDAEILSKILQEEGVDDRQEKAMRIVDHQTALFEGLADALLEQIEQPKIDAAGNCKKILAPTTGESVESVLAKRTLLKYYEGYEFYDLVAFPILYSTEVGNEISTVDIHRLSPEDSPSIVDERLPGNLRHKLAGVTLGHFGAFMDQGFRRNDILWGRLDTAERMIDILLPGAAYEAHRNRLREQAQLAIFEEEMQDANSDRLAQAIHRAWQQGKVPEDADRALIEEVQADRRSGSLLASAARLCLDPTEILNFYRRRFEAPRRIDPQTATESLARSTQIVGKILSDIGDRYADQGRPGKLIARLGGWFWGFIEVAMPRSIPNLLFIYWLKLLYLFEVLLIGFSIFLPAPEAPRFGWTALGITLLVHLAHLLVSDHLRSRRQWRRTFTTFAIAALFSLAAVGILHLAQEIPGWSPPRLWTALPAMALNVPVKPASWILLGLRTLSGFLLAAVLVTSIGNWLSEKNPPKGQKKLPRGLHLRGLALELIPGIEWIEPIAGPFGGPIRKKLARDIRFDFGFIAFYWAWFLFLSAYAAAPHSPLFWGLATVAAIAATAGAQLDVIENFRILALLRAKPLTPPGELALLATGVRGAARGKWGWLFTALLPLGIAFLLGGNPWLGIPFLLAATVGLYGLRSDPAIEKGFVLMLVAFLMTGVLVWL